MFPLNFVLYAMPFYRRDVDRLLAKCEDRNVGVHIIKTLARGPWGDQPRRYTTWYEPFDQQSEIDRAVAFVLSKKVTTLCHTGDVTILPKFLDAAERFQELEPREQASLLGEAGRFRTPFVGRWA